MTATFRQSGHANPKTSIASLMVFIGWLTLGSLFLGAQSPPALPRLAPGWQLELIAKAPQIQHPSVVVSAPDGRVFVAEDPMDIRLPNASSADGRILCFHPNGRVTVFAEKLHAVFGMQFIEGKLYVLHNPKFSVFEEENGVGARRIDLIEQTLADPSALNWNDHVPANFRLGMDGWIYISSGDKGMNARGRDQSEVNLTSGGIVRMRPDGTRLEVVATGVRNILDVALDPEDEMFTYDNTDEHHWMSRLTHMIEGGFYGYPHDFIPRRPYTLWALADYGAGAATGAFCNTEDGLPAEFTSNLFLADFGKRNVLRVGIERDGATFRVASKSEIFIDPPEDFRPVGIAPTSDGKGFYLCDWNHRDSKEDVSVGRLFRILWTGPSPTTTRPAWYLPAASGKPFEASIDQLISSLGHPSRNVRLTAQRRLSDLGKRAAVVTRAAALDTNAPPVQRVHALWSLHGIDPRRASWAAVMMANDPSPMIRRQAVRLMGEHGVDETWGVLRAVRLRVQDSDPSVQLRAAIALGRIGDASTVGELAPLLSHTDLFVRFSAHTALNRIGRKSTNAWPEIVGLLGHPDSRIAEQASFALRETFDPRLVKALDLYIHATTNPLPARLAAIRALAPLHRMPVHPSWGGYHPAFSPAPPRNKDWSGTSPVLASLRRLAATTQEPQARAEAISSLALAKDTALLAEFSSQLPNEHDVSTRTAILELIAAAKSDPGNILPGALNRPTLTPREWQTALSAAESVGSTPAAQALLQLIARNDTPAPRRIESMDALARMRYAPAVSTLISVLGSSDAALADRAADALGRLGTREAMDGLARTARAASGPLKNSAIRGMSRTPAEASAHSDLLLELLNGAEGPLRESLLSTLTVIPNSKLWRVWVEAAEGSNVGLRDAARKMLRQFRGTLRTELESHAARFSPRALQELQGIYADDESARNGAIFARTAQTPGPSDYLRRVVQGPQGRADRGRLLFFDRTGLNCVGCHRVKGEGSDTGPDLSGIGAQSTAQGLAESILEPSKVVREGYQSVAVEFTDGETATGLIKSETADALMFRDASGETRAIAKRLVRNRSSLGQSLMPEGLHQTLSLEEFADLIAYLQSLKETP